MNSRWFKLGVFVLVMAILAVGTVAANAQGPRGGHMGGADNGLVAAAAEVIGINQTELVAALNGGQTIAEVAEANDVALQDIVDAFVADRAAWLTSAVESGRMTQAQVDLMLSHMGAQITLRLAQPFEPYGMGFGNGQGNGFMGQGMHQRGQGRGMQQEQGYGRGMGPGMGFSDADGNGICDHCPFATDTGS